VEHIWQDVDRLRGQFPILREDQTPIDIFTFFEIDLALDAIPFDDLASKYRVEAALKADFSGIYLDAEQYALMEKGPEWKLNRLRFTVAHELAHYFLHRDLPRPENFASLPDFARWNQTYGGKKYSVEQEANEFAGRLLVPVERLRAEFESFAQVAKDVIPNWFTNPEMRRAFAERARPVFEVNTQVIEARLDREEIWPAC
jgi:hypothetical protein